MQGPAFLSIADRSESLFDKMSQFLSYGMLRVTRHCVDN